MKNTLSSLLPLAPLVMGLSACPKAMDLTPPEGPTKVYRYERSDAATDSMGETIYVDTNIHGLDPYEIPGYGVISEREEASLLGEMHATVQRIEDTCDLDLTRPQKNQIQIHYDRSECRTHLELEKDPLCVDPKDRDMKNTCETRDREFLTKCNSITSPSHPPSLFMIVIAYPALTSSAATCVEGIKAEERCTIQSKGIILEEFTDSGEFERGLRVMCKDPR